MNLMARPEAHEYVNFGSRKDGWHPQEKERIQNLLAPLEGWYEIWFEPRSNRRSTKQNAWYFSQIVPAFARYLAQQDYEHCSEAFCHALLKQKFLSVDFIDRETGEIIATPAGSSAKLDTEQFGLFCDKCRHWLQGQFGIVVKDPDPNWRFNQSAPSRHPARKATVPA